MRDDPPGAPNALIVQSTRNEDAHTSEAVRTVGLKPVTATGGLEALNRSREVSPAVVVLDLSVTDVPARRLLEHFGTERVPVVGMTEGPDLRTAVDAMRAGAADVIDKHGASGDLERALRTPLPTLTRDLDTAQVPATFRAQYQELFRQSDRMRALEPVVARLATIAAPVLIRGEAGVGKEGVALAIHYLSDRSRRPFVKVPCAGLPADVLEIELGNMVTAAHDGTLFLHEVGELSSAIQDELGYFLNGSAGALRVLASTSIDMYTLVAARRFRGDLYERLAIVTLDVPPLRERREEIDRLVERALERYAREAERPVPLLTAEMADTLRSYAWPGNIHELENIVKRWVLLGTTEPIRAELAARHAATTRGRRSSIGGALGLREIARAAAREAERVALQEALRRAKGNRAAVARELKVSYKTLLQKLSDVGLATTPRRRQKL